MNSCAMLDDILRQPESLRQAWMHQAGAGSGAMGAAGRAIQEARRVVFTGMGSSLFAAIPAACYLERYGVAAECDLPISHRPMLVLSGKRASPSDDV